MEGVNFVSESLLHAAGILKTGRFVEACLHVGIYGPVGVGKTFHANALGHVACRLGYSVSCLRHDRLLKTLRHARLDNTHEAELRKLLSVDLLIVDDFALDAMDPQESRDTYEVLVERHRAGSVILTSAFCGERIEQRKGRTSIEEQIRGGVWDLSGWPKEVLI